MSTSILTVNLLLFTLLIIFTHNYKISANTIYRTDDYLPRPYLIDDDQTNSLSSESINDDISSSNNWSGAYRPSYIPAMPKLDVRRGVIRFYPYKKRTIPLELQKALYAHGIVGRRR